LPEARSDSLAERIKANFCREFQINIASGLGAQTRSRSQLLEKTQCFLTPEQRHDRCRIARWIAHCVPKIRKFQPAGFHASDSDPPPIGHNTDSVEQVALSNYERYMVKDASIGFGLLRKSSECVLVAFKLETVQFTIYNSEVNPRESMLNTHFLKNNGFRVTSVLGKKGSFCRDSYLGVIHQQAIHDT
jgi:predicted DNA-binding protein (UPF0251 family)